MNEPATNDAASAQLKTDQKMDAVMGIVLRSGVVSAAAIVLAGGILFLIRHKTPVTDYHVFSSEPSDLRTISGIFSEARAFRGRGLIQLGLLVLIATPVARVIFSLFAFMYQKDWKYVLFTAMVLALLLYSLFGSAGASLYFRSTRLKAPEHRTTFEARMIDSGFIEPTYRKRDARRQTWPQRL